MHGIYYLHYNQEWQSLFSLLTSSHNLMEYKFKYKWVCKLLSFIGFAAAIKDIMYYNRMILTCLLTCCVLSVTCRHTTDKSSAMEVAAALAVPNLAKLEVDFKKDSGMSTDMVVEYEVTFHPRPPTCDQELPTTSDVITPPPPS